MQGFTGKVAVIVQGSIGINGGLTRKVAALGLGAVPFCRYRSVCGHLLEHWQRSFGFNAMDRVRGLRRFVPSRPEHYAHRYVLSTISVAGVISGTASLHYCAAKHIAVRITDAFTPT